MLVPVMLVPVILVLLMFVLVRSMIPMIVVIIMLFVIVRDAMNMPNRFIGSQDQTIDNCSCWLKHPYRFEGRVIVSLIFGIFEAMAANKLLT